MNVSGMPAWMLAWLLSVVGSSHTSVRMGRCFARGFGECKVKPSRASVEPVAVDKQAEDAIGDLRRFVANEAEAVLDSTFDWRVDKYGSYRGTRGGRGRGRHGQG